MLCFSVIIFPASENNLSEGTDDAGIARYLCACSAWLGSVLSCNFQPAHKRSYLFSRYFFYTLDGFKYRHARKKSADGEQTSFNFRQDLTWGKRKLIALLLSYALLLSLLCYWRFGFIASYQFTYETWHPMWVPHIDIDI